MWKALSALFCTLCVGILLALVLDWSQIPSVAAIAVVGAFIVHSLEEKRK
ncbi:MAG: hypothetical protein IJB19_05755 [Clostridia bacterium]|nr:hypothetical protein [Clostridia bacterium]